MSALDTGRRAAPAGRSVAQFLTFFLAGEEYGVPILRVQEIRGRSHITPVPNAPPHVRGVVNLRGHVVPILALRARLGMPARADGDASVSIMVTEGQRVVGLEVDAVSDVLDVPVDQIEPVPELGRSDEPSCLSGMARHEERLVVLLDVDSILGGSAALTPTQCEPAADAGREPTP